jgi:hypothetical protein
VTANKHLSADPQEDAPGKFEAAAVADFLASIPDDDDEPGDNRLAVARKLAALGLKLFPCRRNGKAPAIDRWQGAATGDPKKLRKWFGEPTPFNVGVSCAGLVVIDLDMKGGKNGLAAFKKLTGKTLDDFNTLIVETASGGYHVYLSGPPVANSVGKIGPGIDIRSAGGLVVGPGSVVDGKRYTIMRDHPVSSAPDWLLDLIADATTQAEPVKLTDAVTLDTPAAIAFAEAELAEAPIIGEGHRNGAAFKQACRLKDLGVGPEKNRELMLDWNARCCVPPLDEEEISTTVWSAYRSGQNSPGSASVEAEFDDLGPLDDASADRVDAANDNAPDDEFSALGETPDDDDDDDDQRFRELSQDDCAAAAATARPYVIKGAIARGDFGAVIGEPGAGKSLFVPYILDRIARGETAFERKTRQGKVLYVAVEDPHGMKQRVAALRDTHGSAPDFVLLPDFTNLLDEKQRKALIKKVKKHRPVAIGIDTQAVAFPGVEENSAEGMSEVVSFCRGLTRGGAAVILIHHNAKSGGDSARGSGVLDGALDFRILVTKDDAAGIVTAKVGKNRNGGNDWKPEFKIASRQVGKDEDGDLITAAYAQPLDDREQAVREDALSDDDDVVIYHMARLPKGASKRAIAAAAGWKLKSGKPDYSRVDRSMSRVVERKLVVKRGHGTAMKHLLTKDGARIADSIAAEFDKAFPVMPEEAAA